MWRLDTSARSERHEYSSQFSLLNYAIITASSIIKVSKAKALLTRGQRVSKHLEEDIQYEYRNHLANYINICHLYCVS